MKDFNKDKKKKKKLERRANNANVVGSIPTLAIHFCRIN